MRIVSLTCSNTEIICALGASDMLVGVDDHSDYPPKVIANLPRVGPDLGIDINKVAALNPDLVLASLTVPGHEKIVEKLTQAGLNFLAPEPTGLNDVYEDIHLIAQHIDRIETATKIVNEMRQNMPAHTKNLGDNSRIKQSTDKTILVQWWPKPVIAPGRLSWVDDLIRAAGASNPLGDQNVKSAPLEDATVRDIDPDAIVLSWCGVKPDKIRPDVIYRNPAFKGMRALDNRHVFCIPEAHLGRPSPRLLDGYRDLKRVVEALG